MRNSFGVVETGMDARRLFLHLCQILRDTLPPYLTLSKSVRVSRNKGINTSYPVVCYVVQQNPANFLVDRLCVLEAQLHQ